MDASVAHGLAGIDESHLGSSATSPPPPSYSGRRHGDVVVVNELPSDMPIIDAERQLVSAYLGDLIRQILLEPH
jgi:hypothetical protein